MVKMDLLYWISTKVIPKDVGRFWRKVPLPKNKLFIDADNLLGIFTYLVINSQNPKLLVDVTIVEEFTTRNIQMTNRAYYLTALHSGLQWVEDRAREIESNPPAMPVPASLSLPGSVSQGSKKSQGEELKGSVSPRYEYAAGEGSSSSVEEEEDV